MVFPDLIDTGFKSDFPSMGRQCSGCRVKNVFFKVSISARRSDASIFEDDELDFEKPRLCL
jgi:hypothetical protein